MVRPRRDEVAGIRKRYRAELSAAGASKIIRDLLASSKRAKTITLLYGAKDQKHNEAIVLRDLFVRVAAKETDR